jgi:hypothetical protein
MGKTLTYYYAIGKKDITGDDWGDVFSDAIGGKHFASPVGIVDVAHEKMAWSTKTVQHSNPHRCLTVRIISGRNSPDYSFGITDLHADIQKTGDAVLKIWNARVDIAKKEYYPLREAVLVRRPERREFTYFEAEIGQYAVSEFYWRENARGNLEGVRIVDDKHVFTWQFHGSQFTIIHEIPSSAIRFKLRQVPLIDLDSTLVSIGFEEGWISFS